MRVVFEINKGGSEEDVIVPSPEETDSHNETDVPENHWVYAIATAFLGAVMVIPPLSSFVNSLPPIQYVQDLVSTSVLSARSGNLANRIVKAMQRKSYQLSTNPSEVNIIYLRGTDQYGNSNGNRINSWSDRRLVLMFRFGSPTIVGNWAATTKPGLPAIKNPTNNQGAAFIEPGQYSAWRVGTHYGMFGRVELGLVQVAPVNFRRDVNRNGKVDSTPVQLGIIGLNQHSGSDQELVDRASYACLAGQSESGHLHSFMPLVKADPRYRRNRAFVFTTTILDASDL